jgi:signal transduction histidine kinase
LQQLANQAAVAIENARLYGRAEEIAILEERQRIAQEMHDGLGQVLAYLRLKAREMENALASGKVADTQQSVSEVKRVLDSAYEDVRASILALRPQNSEAGLMPMLQDYLDGFRLQSGMAIGLKVANARATQLSPRAAIQLVRVIQEALTNVRKHAQASKVEVRFEVEDEKAVVTIEDDGVGFDPARASLDSPFHFGLQTMKERLQSVGGSLAVDSQPGSGTRVIARLPLGQ